jgi:hypothetical protein
LLIVLVNAILVVQFINIAGSPGALVPLQASPAIAIAILIIPLFDTLRVFSIRIFNRRSPFSPDRNHIHHILLDRGMTHKAVSFTLIVVNIFFVAVSYFLSLLSINILMPLLITLAFGGFTLVYLRKPRLMVVATDDREDILQLTKPSRILPLTPSKKAAERN